MPWFSVIWTPENREHIARHDVTPEEFEEVVFQAGRRQIGKSKTSGRPAVTGQTSSGRMLYCVFEYVDGATILPVTAFDPTEQGKP
jgi:uncharacterized DUF497 family protein